MGKKNWENKDYSDFDCCKGRCQYWSSQKTLTVAVMGWEENAVVAIRPYWGLAEFPETGKFEISTE